MAQKTRQLNGTKKQQTSSWAVKPVFITSIITIITTITQIVLINTLTISTLELPVVAILTWWCHRPRLCYKGKHARGKVQHELKRGLYTTISSFVKNELIVLTISNCQSWKATIVQIWTLDDTGKQRRSNEKTGIQVLKWNLEISLKNKMWEWRD